jgi:hypothetical protein
MAGISCALDIQGSDLIARRLAMQIKKHDRSHMVELRDGSASLDAARLPPKAMLILPGALPSLDEKMRPADAAPPFNLDNMLRASGRKVEAGSGVMRCDGR